jgi:hypothetical protein
MIKRIKSLADKYFIGVDSILSVVISFLCFLVLGNCIEKLEDDLFQELISVSVSLLGFLIATVAIIFSFKDGSRITKLQESKHYYQVIDIYISAIFWESLFAILFTGIFMFDFSQMWKVYILIAFIVFSVIKIRRCIWIARHMFYLSIPKKQ